MAVYASVYMAVYASVYISYRVLFIRSPAAKRSVCNLDRNPQQQQLATKHSQAGRCWGCIHIHIFQLEVGFLAAMRILTYMG